MAGDKRRIREGATPARLSAEAASPGPCRLARDVHIFLPRLLGTPLPSRLSATMSLSTPFVSFQIRPAAGVSLVRLSCQEASTVP